MRLNGQVDLPKAADGPAGGGGPVPGPVRIPRPRRGVPLVGWIVAGLLLLLSILIYAATRQYPASPLQAVPPSWGRLTLAHVALNASRAVGDSRPSDALWVSTARMYAVPYLTGQHNTNAEADFLVALRGHFHAATPSTTVTLPGSLRAGDRLVLLVRGFDGHVTGLMITDRSLHHLGSLGLVHSLSLGLGLL